MPYIFQYGLSFPLLLGLSNFHANLSPIVLTKNVYFPMKNVVWRGETSAVTNQERLIQEKKRGFCPQLFVPRIKLIVSSAGFLA